MLKLAGAGLLGFIAYLLLAQRPIVATTFAKVTGTGVSCPWSKLIAAPWHSQRLRELQTIVRGQINKQKEEPALGIQSFATLERTFWLRSGGIYMNAETLLEFVLAEQDWLAELVPDMVVKPGEVVVDVGAHVGTFGADALHRGASKVIMVEPDPTNVECIRRNFAAEIKSGQVVLIPEGAWDKEDSIEFTTGVANSGTGSFVNHETTGGKLKVRVRPLDAMLREIGFEKVDFIKMDIEGAERHALAGAAKTLRRFRPRLMLDAYHRDDDVVVLPKLIRAANSGYQEFCAACARHGHTGDRMAPYAIFFK